MNRAERLALLPKIAERRILVLDGGMGTMLQRHSLTEADWRGARFADWPRDLKGNNDLLSITKPDVISGIHRAYFEAGSDIVSTNSFCSTRIAQADYGLEDLAREMNRASAALARKVADAQEHAQPGHPRYVAGSLGPTNRAASISPKVEDPGFRDIDFDQLRDAYKEAALGLLEGGADLLLIETVFDTLNAKAALLAAEEAQEESGITAPIILSGTIVDRSGRILSGQTLEAFWISLRHARPFAFSLNCALGADLLRPYVQELSDLSETLCGAYPNAGLPNAFGGYDETPAETARHIKSWAEQGFVNIVGGCCGTTPEHIRAIAEAVKDVPPRQPRQAGARLRLSGLEPFAMPAF